MPDEFVSQLDPLTTPANADLLHIIDDVAGTPTDKKIVISDITPYENVKYAGAIGDGVANDTTAVQAAFNQANQSNGAPVLLPVGTYLCNLPISLTLTRDIHIVGPGTIKNVTSTETLKLTNSEHLATTLNGATTAKSRAITVTSATGVQAGDVMVITSTKSWDATDVALVAGEILTVEGVSGAVVTTKEMPDDVYLDTDVVKFYRPYRLTIRDLKLLGDTAGGVVGGQNGIWLQNVFNPIFENVEVVDHDDRGILLEQCKDATLIDCHTRSIEGQTGIAYGLILDSSASTTIIGGTYHAERHGFTTGGTLPTRDTSFYGVDISSDPNNSAESFDTHANTDRTYLSHCRIHDGFGLAGRNHVFENCKIRGLNSKYLSPDDFHADEYCKFIDCDIANDSLTQNTLRIRPVSELSTALHLGVLEFRGGKVFGDQTALPMIHFSNAFASTTCTIDLVKVDGALFDYDGANSSNYAVDHSAVNAFTVTEFLYTGGAIFESAQRQQRMNTNVTRFRFTNSDLKNTQGDSFTFLMSSGDLFEMSDFTYDATQSGSQGTVSVTVAKVLRGKFTSLTNRPINFSSSTELQYNSIESNISTTFDLVPAKTYQFKSQDNVIAYGTAAPVAGTWTDGDIVKNTALSIDGNNMILREFACHVSGTPGTWASQYVSTVTPAT